MFDYTKIEISVRVEIAVISDIFIYLMFNWNC